MNPKRQGPTSSQKAPSGRHRRGDQNCATVASATEHNVYLAPAADVELFKIGITADLEVRFAKLGDINEATAWVAVCDSKKLAAKLESMLHFLFAPDNVQVEREGATEWFDVRCLERALTFVREQQSLLRYRLLAAYGDLRAKPSTPLPAPKRKSPFSGSSRPAELPDDIDAWAENWIEKHIGWSRVPDGIYWDAVERAVRRWNTSLVEALGLSLHRALEHRILVGQVGEPPSDGNTAGHDTMLWFRHEDRASRRDAVGLAMTPASENLYVFARDAHASGRLLEGWDGDSSNTFARMGWRYDLDRYPGLEALPGMLLGIPCAATDGHAAYARMMAVRHAALATGPSKTAK